MPEQPTPTYREEQGDERPRYVCLVPDSSQDSGTCGFWTWDEEGLKQHLQQRHAGLIVKAPTEGEAEDEAGALVEDDTLKPTPPGASSSPVASTGQSSAAPADTAEPVPPVPGSER